MKLNTAARKALSKAVADDDMLAVVPLSQNLGAAGAHSDGTARSGSTVYSHEYARRRGIDHTTRGHRLDLVNAWLTLTPTELRFDKVNQWSVRSLPKGHLATIDRDGVSLEWFDVGGLSMVHRVLHFHFADRTHLLATTAVRSGLRKQPYTDEPDLLIQELGASATQIEGD